MPQVYLKKEIYDKIIGSGESVGIYVNRVVEESLATKAGRKK